MERVLSARRLVFPAVRRVAWEAYDVPEAVEAHVVVARAECSLISAGTEVAVYSGTHIGFTLAHPPFPLIPFYPGYALVGRVLAAGAAVENIRPGQRVVMDAPHGSVGVVDVRRGTVVPIPDDLSNEEAAFIPLAGIALSAPRMAPVELGDSVAVYGLGLVGQLAARLYRLAGARPVIGLDLIGGRLDVAAAAGITPVNTAGTDVRAAVDRLCGGSGVDVVVEATGSPDVIPASLALAAEGGRVVLLGSPRGPSRIDAYSLIHRPGISVIGAHERVQPLGLSRARRWTKRRNLDFLARTLAKGELRVEPLISHRISPDEAPEIYEALADRPGEFLGVLIEWRSGGPRGSTRTGGGTDV